MRLPQTWTELLARLTPIVGGDADDALRDVQEWLRQAVEARWGRSSLHDLDRVQRQLAFQKASGVLLALEDAGLPDELVAPAGDLPPLLLYRDGSIESAADYPGRRAAIAAVVARYFDGVAVDGPAWRVAPLETGRLEYDEYAAAADFG